MSYLIYDKGRTLDVAASMREFMKEYGAANDLALSLRDHVEENSDMINVLPPATTEWEKTAIIPVINIHIAEIPPYIYHKHWRAALVEKLAELAPLLVPQGLFSNRGNLAIATDDSGIPNGPLTISIVAFDYLPYQVIMNTRDEQWGARVPFGPRGYAAANAIVNLLSNALYLENRDYKYALNNASPNGWGVRMMIGDNGPVQAYVKSIFSVPPCLFSDDFELTSDEELCAKTAWIYKTSGYPTEIQQILECISESVSHQFRVADNPDPERPYLVNVKDLHPHLYFVHDGSYQPLSSVGSFRSDWYDNFTDSHTNNRLMLAITMEPLLEREVIYRSN